MKKLVLISFLLYCCSQLYSQKFKSGLVLGLSGSQIEGDGYGGYNKLGFIAGGFTNTSFNEKWSTQFEIYYITKGSFKAPNPDQGSYNKFYLNLNYIEVPLSLRYHYNKFMFEGGFYLSKFLNSTFKDENGVRENPFTQYPIKSFDFGGFVGINYNITERLIFNLRSKHSVVPFRDFQNFDQNIGIMNKLFNRGWYHLDINFTIRYQFGE